MTGPHPGTPPAEAAATTPGQACRHAYGAAIARALGMDWPGPGIDITGPGGDPVFAAGWEAAAEAVADLLSAGWPKCPDGCGCRLGTTGPDGQNDADRFDCACDGPCCMECRENGYPDAPSYRDLENATLTADRDRYRKALETIADGRHGSRHEPWVVIATAALGDGA